MKAMLSFLLVLLVLGTAGLVACGGGKNGAAPAAGAGLSWNDMPVYSGAKSIDNSNWAIPPVEGEYTKAEWRYFETKDSADEVSAFYKSRMAAKGWSEQGVMNLPGMNWGMYSKNDENDSAAVWISSQDGKTVIALFRANK